MDSLLERTHSVLALLDADAPDFPEAALAIEKYFHGKGKVLTIKALHKHSWIFAKRHDDMLLSLYPKFNLHIWFTARNSKSAFKVGRFQIGRRRKVFDLVVSDAPAVKSLQSDVFSQMTKILERIK